MKLFCQAVVAATLLALTGCQSEAPAPTTEAPPPPAEKSVQQPMSPCSKPPLTVSSGSVGTQTAPPPPWK